MLRSLSFLAALALLGSLAGCATSAQMQSDLNTLADNGVPPALYRKAQQGVILDLPDVATLARRNVPDDITLRLLQRTRATYTLAVQDVERLKKAGVSDRVINYLLATPQLYPRVEYVPAPYGWYGPGWYDPGPVIIVQPSGKKCR
jgi:hypothetical protein